MSLPKEEQPVLAYWNFASAPVTKEQLNGFIEKMEEKIARRVHQVSMICDVRNTDTSVINIIEQEHPNFAIYHASPLKTVNRICVEMMKHASLCQKPGLIVLVSDSGDYWTTMSALTTEGWKTLVIYPNDADRAFQDLGRDGLCMDDIMSQAIKAAPLLEARSFLIQIPSVPQTQLDSFLSKEQQCVYFNARSREAVIVIEAENNELIQKSLEHLIQRICATVGVSPANMLPLPQNSLKRTTTPGTSNGLVQLMIFGDCCQPHSERVHRLVTLLPQYPNITTTAANHQLPRPYGPEPAPNIPSNASAPTRPAEHGFESINEKKLGSPDIEQQVDDPTPPDVQTNANYKRGRIQFKGTSVPDFALDGNSADGANGMTRLEGMDPFSIGAAQFKERDRAQQRLGSNNHWLPKSESYGGYLNGRGNENKMDSRNTVGQTEKKARFNGDPWKQAEESFIRRIHQPQQTQAEPCEVSNSDDSPTGAYCDSGIHEGSAGNEIDSDREPQHKDPSSDYYYLPYGVKQNGQRRQRERFRKPAPQCVFWENRRHRQETGCTLWHPRESCRFYPTCAHQARDCGFAHPFCGPKCMCAPSKRNPQMNHWTEQLEKSFGALISP